MQLSVQLLVEQASPAHLLKAADIPKSSSGREPGSQYQSSAAPQAPPAVLHTQAGVSSTDTCPHQGPEWTLPTQQAGHSGMLPGFVWFTSTRIAEKCIQDKVLWILLQPCAPGLQTKFNWFILLQAILNRKARDHFFQKLNFLLCCTKIFVMLSTNFMVSVLRYWLTSVTFLHCPLALGAACCCHNTCFPWSVFVLHTGLAPACWVSSCEQGTSSLTIYNGENSAQLCCPGVHQQIPSVLTSPVTHPDNTVPSKVSQQVFRHRAFTPNVKVTAKAANPPQKLRWQQTFLRKDAESILTTCTIKCARCNHAGTEVSRRGKRPQKAHLTKDTDLSFKQNPRLQAGLVQNL